MEMIYESGRTVCVKKRGDAHFFKLSVTVILIHELPIFFVSNEHFGFLAMITRKYKITQFSSFIFVQGDKFIRGYAGSY